MTDCILCQIARKEIPVSVIYEDDLVISFLDIRPINPGHILVIPKKHVAYMEEMDEETGMHLFKITQRMERIIRKSNVKSEGVNLFLADGKAAFQEVFHVHMHVFPRYKGDKFSFNMEWGETPSREFHDDLASQFREIYSSFYNHA